MTSANGRGAPAAGGVAAGGVAAAGVADRAPGVAGVPAGVTGGVAPGIADAVVAGAAVGEPPVAGCMVAHADNIAVIAAKITPKRDTRCAR